MRFIITKFLIALCLVLFISSGYVSAQTISGSVKNAQTKEPLAGANIVQLGTPNGVSTNDDGTFSLTLNEENIAEIRISYIGFEAQKISVSESTEFLQIYLMPDTRASLEETIIFGTRAGQDDPITQTTISKQEIEKSYVGQDPSAVLERVAPSVISYSDAGANIGNYVQFRLRGIDQTRINTTLNGVPLNDMIDQGVFFSNFSDFSNSVESIQVQRGVGTSSNGTASYAGSINFESIQLSRPSPEFELQLTGGSFNTKRASGEVHTGKMENNLAVYSRFTRTLSDGYKNHSGSDSYSFFFSGGYLGSKDILKVTAFAGKTQNDQSYLPVLLGDIQNNPRTNNNSENSTDDFEQELVQLQYSRTLNEQLVLNSTLYYAGSRGAFPFGLSPTNQLLFGLQNDHYGFLSDIDYRLSNLNLKAGVHGYLFRRENINSTAPNTANPDYQDQTDKDEVSFFTKANVKVGNFNFFGDVQLRYVTLAFRAEEVISFGGPVPANGVDAGRDWLFVNPKVGVNYRFSNNNSAYISFGRTSREPTRTDILQGDGSAITEANLASVQNENIVKEEHVNDLEAGYRYRSHWLSFTANYFYMAFQDEISLVGALAQNSYVPLRQNVPESYRTGFELVSNAHLGTRWHAGLNATYLTTNVSRFENASSQTFRNVEHIFAPKWIVSPRLRFEPSAIIGIELRGRYVSESFIELSNASAFVLPEYFVLNGQVDVRISQSLHFSLLVNNIFDKRYFNEGVPVDANFDGTVEGPGFRIQPPLNVYAQLNIEF